MKKLITLLMTMVGLGLLSLAVLIGLLHTSYSTAIINHSLNRWSEDISVEKASYQAPWHFTINGLYLKEAENELYIPKLDVWINPGVFVDGKLALDSVLIDGLSLQETKALPSYMRNVFFYQIAFNNLDIAYDGIIARGINLQIDKPHWESKTQQVPFGDLQLSAKHLYYHGESIDDLLLDMNYQAQNSTLYGSSFRWRAANISGQAEQFSEGWSLVNITIEKLNLLDPLQPTLNLDVQSLLAEHVNHINSLDILNSSFQYANVMFNNIDLSLENLSPQKSLWQQDNGYLSFSAESVNVSEVPFISPQARLAFNTNQLSVEEFDSDFYQGRLQFSGVFQPDSIALSSFNASGIKWLVDEGVLLNPMIPLPQQLSINKLDIKNSQLIQLEHAPYWQVSGINIEADNLELIRSGGIRLWQGQLQASANSLSYDDVIASQAVLEMQNRNEIWTLDRFFLPLDNGYLDATGEWDLASDGKPWNIMLASDGFPIDYLTPYLDLPIDMEGILDLNAQLQGFSSSPALFSHSLSGVADIGVREGTLTLYDQQSTDHSPATSRSITQAFELSNLSITADRGSVVVFSKGISGMNLTGQIEGQFDLVNPTENQAELTLTQECSVIRLNLINSDFEEQLTCNVNE